MREDQFDQAERKATLENDRKVLEQRGGSTFHQHSIAAADETNQGRFRSTGTPRVIGSTPAAASQYPAAGAHQFDPCGLEPSLGFSIDNPDRESSTTSPVSVVEATGAPVSAAPSSDTPQLLADDVETGIGAPPSSEIMAAQRVADRVGNSPAADVSAGRPPVRNPWGGKPDSQGSK